MWICLPTRNIKEGLWITAEGEKRPSRTVRCEKLTVYHLPNGLTHGFSTSFCLPLGLQRKDLCCGWFHVFLHQLMLHPIDLQCLRLPKSYRFCYRISIQDPQGVSGSQGPSSISPPPAALRAQHSPGSAQCSLGARRAARGSTQLAMESP